MQYCMDINHWPDALWFDDKQNFAWHRHTDARTYAKAYCWGWMAPNFAVPALVRATAITSYAVVSHEYNIKIVSEFAIYNPDFVEVP